MMQDSSNTKLHLVVTMAGRGSRFAVSGELNPKPLIHLRGKPFFWWATESVRAHDIVKSITFVVLQEHIQEFHIDNVIREFYPDATIVVLDHVTRGAAETAYLGIQHIQDSSPLGFLDCDLAFDMGNPIPTLSGLSDETEGLLCYFVSNRPSYSYILLDDHENAIGTIEKQVVSNRAIAGFYIFRDVKVFQKYYMIYQENCNYTEFFMSGIYDIMLKKGARLGMIQLSSHFSFGTPEELRILTQKQSLPQWFVLQGMECQHNDIRVSCIFPGGSGAITALIQDNHEFVVRKFAPLDIGDKLMVQALWIRENENELPLVKVLKEAKHEFGYYYDMEFSKYSQDYYEIISHNDLTLSLSILDSVVQCVDKFHHIHMKDDASDDILHYYLTDKIVKNIIAIRSAVTPLVGEESFRVNGEKYTLTEWEFLQDIEKISSIFSDKRVSKLHGDITVDNIIVDPSKPLGWYLIDPNPSNIFDSPLLEWGKLFQSLHTGYEAQIKTGKCILDGNNIQISQETPETYPILFSHLLALAQDRFGDDGVKQIFLHEIIHYLRLVPYKFKMSQEKGLLFYGVLCQLIREYQQKYMA